MFQLQLRDIFRFLKFNKGYLYLYYLYHIIYQFTLETVKRIQKAWKGLMLSWTKWPEP